MRSLKVYVLLMLSVIIGCAQVDNYFRSEISEVERYYYKGRQAEAVREWEAAFAYYKHAHDSAKEKQAIIRFNNPKQDNYNYTISLLYKAMDRVGVKIVKPGDWQSPMRRQVNMRQKEMFERMALAKKLFAEAEKFVGDNDYLKAMELTDQIIGAYPFSGEARKARQLKKEYHRQLRKHRRQLLDVAILYYQEQNHKMAKQTFDQLFATYPDNPEAVKTKAKIERYIQQQIEKADKLNVEKVSAAN